MIKKFLLCCVIVTSILSCQKTTLTKVYKQIKTGPGPEDIVLDAGNNRMLVSCNERRSGMPHVGEIYAIDLTTDEATILPRNNFPNIPFNPHGFDMQTVNGINYLYVIDHFNDSSATTAIVQFKINASNLEFVRAYTDSLLISPNDLTVMPNGSFYFSNDKNSRNILDLLTDPRNGSVGYCDGNSIWKKVDSHLSYPNGLYNENNKLYLATSRNTALYTYDVQPDGSLQNKFTLSTINGIDNITANGNELIAAVHPDLIKFALLSLLPENLSPSRTYSINKQTGEARMIFDDDGSTITGSSTAVVHGSSLYLGQVFGEFVLKIENYDK
jgi:hypothetical protein